MHILYNGKTQKEISVPSDIDELDSKQYLAYIKLIHCAEQTNMSIRELRTRILKIVCPINFGFRYIILSRSNRNLLWERLYQLSEMMDSFFDIQDTADKRNYLAHRKSGANLLPTWGNYRGPDDMLNNITWGDFVSCMNLLASYKNSIDNKDAQESDMVLSQLFHTLYKPIKHPKSKKEIPVYVKQHALQFFSHVFELISTVPIPIHGSEIDFSIIFSDNGSTTKDNKMGWNGLVFAVAESGVFGNTENVNNENFWSVMLYLYKCAFDNQSLNEKKK